jgi:hypothetical protein
MSVIIPQQSGRSATVERPTAVYSQTAQLTAWRIVQWLGLAFLIMSLIDIALGWYPTRFGSPEWEFGTISATVAGLSIPTLSLYLVLASSFALDQPKISKTMGIVMVVLALALPALGVFWLTNVPLALRATASNDIVNFGVKKSIVKTLVLFAGYEILYGLGAWKALRRRTSA